MATVTSVTANKVTKNLWDLVARDCDGNEVQGTTCILFIPIHRGDNAVNVVNRYCDNYTSYSECRELFLDAAKKVKF